MSTTTTGVTTPAPTVTVDLVDGHRTRLSSAGYGVERVLMVRGLVGTASEIPKLAIDLCGVDLWDEHPTINDIFATDFDSEAVSTDTCRVRILYAFRGVSTGTSRYPSTVDGDPYIEVGTTLEQMEAIENSSGTVVSVAYGYPGGGTTSAPTSQTPPMPVLRPRYTVTFRRLESVNPSSKSYTYTGKVNQANWGFDPGCAARTYLCTGISGYSDDGGYTWNVTYTFAYKADAPTGNWDTAVYWIDPNTGRPPADLVDNTGYGIVQLYTEADFDNLGINDPATTTTTAGP